MIKGTKISLIVHSFGITDVGYVREHNEDAWGFLSDRGFFVLADGMGGEKAGEIASQLAVDELLDEFESIDEDRKRKNLNIDDVEDKTRRSIERVNRDIYMRGQHEESLRGMGTTICCLYTYDNIAIYAHVGDSRIYRYRKKKSKERLEQLTEDHSLVQELVSGGELAASLAEQSPFKHILTRAVGTHASVKPAIGNCIVEPGDLFMLCSDGLTNYATPAEIQEVLNEAISSPVPPAEYIEKAATDLVSLAMSHGGGDNVTAILVYFENDIPRQ